MPTAWDETELLAGDPDRFVVFARRKGRDWYIAGINGLDEDLVHKTNALQRLLQGKKYEALVVRESENHQDFKITRSIIGDGAELPQAFKIRKKGGFLWRLKAL